MIDQAEIEKFSKLFSNIDLPENIYITGATGLIGSALVMHVSNLSKMNNSKINIYALCRNEEKLRSMVGDEAIFVNYDLMTPIELEVTNGIFIHAASPTGTDRFVSSPTDVLEEISVSTQNVVKFCIASSVDKIIYLSTMEVYGETSHNELLSEASYNGIDLMNSRNCYPISKMYAENYLVGASHQYGLNIDILRLTQVIAPPIERSDKRVIFEFARLISQNNDIVLKTTGSTMRNYVYYLDVLSAIVCCFNESRGVNVYNVSNSELISILDLAKKMIELAGSKVTIFFDTSQNQEMKYRDDLFLGISSSKIKSKGWNPKYSLDYALIRLLKIYGAM